MKQWFYFLCCFFSLQVFSQLRSVFGGASVSLHLVEVSPALSRLQAQNLTGNQNQEADTEDELVYRRGETAAGLPVSWYRRLDDVPSGITKRLQSLQRLFSKMSFLERSEKSVEYFFKA